MINSTWRAPSRESQWARATAMQLSTEMFYAEQDLADLQEDIQTMGSIEGRARELQVYAQQLEAHAGHGVLDREQIAYIQARKQVVNGLMQQIAQAKAMHHHRLLDMQMRQRQAALARQARNQTIFDHVAGSTGLPPNLGGPLVRPGVRSAPPRSSRKLSRAQLPVGGPQIFHGATMPMPVQHISHGWGDMAGMA